jgi:hypothetical protein
MIKMKTMMVIAVLITFVFVSAAFAGQYEYFKVENVAQIKEVFTYFPAPNPTAISKDIIQDPKAQGWHPFGGLPPGFTESGRPEVGGSEKLYGVYRLTISPAGDVTQIRVIVHAYNVGTGAKYPRADIAILHALMLWKAKPSAKTRTVDVVENYHTYFCQS